MKLNLLPTTVAKGRQAQSAVFFSALIAIAGLVIGGYLDVSSQKALEQAKTDQAASVGPADAAYKKSAEADSIMSDEKSVALIRDATLAKDMIDHNDVYPKLYDSIKPYIPKFFRINSMSASSAGKSANVVLVGTIDTYQQYADLMLAFSRYPGLLSISRSGFSGQMEVVPNINQIDSVGKPRLMSNEPIPDDKLARLAYFQAHVQQEGYTGAGDFGSGTDGTRGAMPEASLVTVTMSIANVDLTVPDPRATLTAGAAGGGGAPAATAGPGAGTAATPGPGAGAAGAGATGAKTGSGSKKGGKNADDSSD